MKKINLIEWLQTDSHGKQSATRDHHGTKSRELPNNPRLYTYSQATLKRLWRYAAMITLLLTLACGEMWGVTKSATQFAASQSGTTYTVSARSGYGDLSGLTVTTVGANGGVTSNRLKVPAGTFNIATSDGTTPITAITITWRNSSKQYPTSNSECTVNTGTATTSSQTTTWSGSATSVSFTNTTANTFQVVGLSVTYGGATYYYRGEDNSWNATAMTISSGGTYEYKASSRNGHQFKIATSSDSWDYNYTYVDAGFYGTSSDIGDYSKDNCYIWMSGSYYIVVFKPNTAINTTNKPKICASATLPQDQFTISFNKGSGSGSMSSITPINAGSNQAVTANSFTAPSGYRFAGWKANVDVKVDGSTKTAGTVLADGVTIQSVLSDITLTAQWELIPTYTVTYDANGGTGSVPTDATAYAEGASVTVLGKNTLSKAGSMFVGWRTGASSGTWYIEGNTFEMGGDDVTLYAQWRTLSCPSSGTMYSLTMGNVTTTEKVTHGTEVTIEKHATIVNGTATLKNKNGSSDDKAQFSKANPGQIYLNGADAQLKLELGCALAEGDSIIVTSSDTTHMSFSKTDSRSTTPATVTHARGKVYVIPAESPLIGCTTLYCWRRADKGLRVTKLIITRPVSCSTPDAPTDFTAGSISATGATFTITDAADAASYDIYYSTESTAPTSGTAATTTSTSKTKEVTGLTAGTTYYAWVRSVCDASHKSAWVALNPGGDTHTFATSCVAPTTVNITGTYHYFPGETISLTAAAEGGSGTPTTYQWYKGGTADGNIIEGATSATYTKENCTFADAGSYYCKVTRGGSCSTFSGNYDVKILHLYVNTGRNGTPYGDVDFVKVNATTARATIFLGANWDYGFNIADGCGHYYGNTSSMNVSNCTGWTMNVDGTDCLMHTTNGATYTFTVDYTSLTAPVVSITYPSANQATDKIIYFDNQTVNWSTLHYRIGRSDHTQATAMTKVPGTNNLYTVTTSEYNNFSGWHIANNAGWTGSNSIYRTYTNGDAYSITYATAHEGGAVTDAAITVTPTTSRGMGGDKDLNDNCDFYNYSITSGMKTQNVAISPYSNGTITVNYTNTSGSAATLTSGNADLAHSVILTSITAVADEGYDASAITINGGAYSGANYVVTGNTTIAASFTLKTYTISYNKGTNGTGSKASETKTHGVNFTLPGSTFTYDGHAQDGWSTSDGGALAYTLSGSYTTNAAQEFFPHWKCNTPTITDNGDNTVSITVPSGTTVRYTTDGTDPSSSTGTVYSTTFSIAADCTVKAIAYQSNCTNSEIASQDCDYTAPANFQMIANSSAGSEQTLSSGESITQGSKNCATLTGGTAVYTGPGMKVQKGSPYGWYFGSNSDVITITLTGHILQVGSVIAIDGNCGSSNNGIKINTNGIVKTGESSGGEFSGTYTVKAGDTDLIGTNVLTLTRSTGSATRMYSITLSNCQAATPCTTPTLPSLSNQAGCSYSAWNATPSNASTISAAGESISYSWKKGATEKATTASYTPDANGTDYTVTVTVSKAGSISTSVTSSALTATKYGNPTVTGPSDAEYEVGESASNLSVTATPDHGESLTYQWYSNTAKSTSSPTPTVLENCTTSTYKPSTAATGTTYYFCKVSGGCADVYSSIATVTVSEVSCFKFKCESQSSAISAITANANIPASTWTTATLTGGTMKNTSSGSLNVNKTYGLVMESGKEVTVTLAAGSSLEVGSVIKLSAGVSDADGSQTSGLAINGNACTPPSYTSSTAGAPFTQTYTVTALDGLAGTNTFTVAMKSDLTKTYLNGITVTRCADCTPIDPELSYSKTTIWMDDADLTATATLTGYYGTPTITYTSSDPTVVRVDNASTGAITALKRGTATITATISETTVSTTDYCGNTATCNITVKDTTCGWTEIASAVLTSKSAATTTGGTALINLGDKDKEDPDGSGYKLTGKNKYFGIQLEGEYKVGDSIEFKLYTKNSTSFVRIHATGDNDTIGTLLYQKDLTEYGQTLKVGFRLTAAQATTLNVKKKVAIFRNNTDNKQNHNMQWVKVYRYACPDIFIYDDAAGTHEWSDDDNWIGAAGHGSGLPTSEDRVFINESVTVDVATAAAAELHITNGSMVTVEKSITVGDVNIETGSTLNVAKDGESGITVATNSLYLKGGWNSSYTTYDMPRIYIDPASTLTKVVNTVNFDISVDSRNYYPIAVPFRVKVSDVDYANSTLASFSNYGANGQYVIKDYDGARRAENGPDQVNNWKVVPQKDEKNNDVYLEPGRGYIMTAISIPSYGGGVIRFPMSFTNDWTAEGEQGTVDAVTKNVVAVKAYEGAATAGDKKVNKGWNLLGVPFMSCYGTGADMGTDGVVMQGKFDFKTGDWKEEAVRYVNVPVHDFSEYIQVDMEDDDPVTVLRPGWCFFVQVEEDGDLTFLTADQAASSSLPIYAPKRGVKADMPTVKTGIILSDGEKSDKTTFLVSDKYNGAEYEINADLEKMFGNGYTLATYSLSGETRLAYNALSNADAANIIPIGYRAPAEGEYTFSINPRYAENGAFESVNLIDYETGIVTDLLKFSYTFSTGRTQNDTRFALNVVKQKETPTDIELVGGDAQVDGPRKLLLDGKMYIILDGKMFDAQGKRVQ